MKDKELTEIFEEAKSKVSAAAKSAVKYADEFAGRFNAGIFGRLEISRSDAEKLLADMTSEINKYVGISGDAVLRLSSLRLELSADNKDPFEKESTILRTADLFAELAENCLEIYIKETFAAFQFKGNVADVNVSSVKGAASGLSVKASALLCNLEKEKI